MAEWFYTITGKYAYQFTILAANELQFMVAALFFCIGFHRKSRFWLRLIIGLAAEFGLLWVGVVCRTEWEGLLPRIVVTLLQYSSTLPLLVLCLDEEKDVLLKAWCSSVAVKEIGGTLYPLLQFILGYDSHTTMQILPFPNLPTDVTWTIYYCVHFLIYFLIWRGVRGFFGDSFDSAARRNGVFLSVTALLILGILGAVTSHYRDESQVLYICSRMFAMAVAAFILMTYAGIEFRSRTRADMAMMEHVLSEERKQFAQMKENIDIINMRCHDLKHQLEDFSGRLTDREIAELQEAMEIYDSNIRTGNEALDTVLYIHQLTCRKEGIILTCLADGSALSFMRTRHVYALFNNAIGNAIEAVRKVADPEKRVIGLTVEKAGGNVEIEVTNYYEGNLQIAGDGILPATTKADSSRHGFGTMSMRYIAEQYRGSLTLEARHGIYTLHVTVPLPDSAKAKS